MNAYEEPWDYGDGPYRRLRVFDFGAVLKAEWRKGLPVRGLFEEGARGNGIV